jgi:4-amino-4-deoxy-L-arabinose transferase-like glycosyltransferase
MFKTPAGGRRVEILLAALWLLVQSYLLLGGVHTELEAEKYTGAAAFFARTGALPAPKYFFYSTEIFVIFFFNAIGLGYTGVALFQVLLNGLATLLLYRLTKVITGSREVARLTTLLFLLFLPLQQWNTYLYTESLFISLTLLVTYGILLRPPHHFKNFLVHLSGLLLLCLTRPSGLFFILPFFLYAIGLARGSFRKVLVGTGLLAVPVVLYLANRVLNGGEDMNALKPIREGHVICGIPGPGPARLQLVETGNAIRDIYYYIVHNPAHFAGLTAKRLFSFFNLTRPFYSGTHNAFLLAVMLPVYSFGFISLLKRKTLLNHHLFSFILILTVLYSLFISFQCDDYHSRFIMPLFPFIFLLAARGFYYCVDRLKQNGHRPRS